nr:MAG TPA: hypothetical protein [Caudoviricetes sp.]
MLGRPFYLLPLLRLEFSSIRNNRYRSTDLVSTQNLESIS